MSLFKATVHGQFKFWTTSPDAASIILGPESDSVLVSSTRDIESGLWIHDGKVISSRFILDIGDGSKDAIDNMFIEYSKLRLGYRSAKRVREANTRKFSPNTAASNLIIRDIADCIDESEIRIGPSGRVNLTFMTPLGEDDFRINYTKKNKWLVVNYETQESFELDTDKELYEYLGIVDCYSPTITNLH